MKAGRASMYRQERSLRRNILSDIGRVFRSNEVTGNQRLRLSHRSTFGAVCGFHTPFAYTPNRNPNWSNSNAQCACFDVDPVSVQLSAGSGRTRVSILSSHRSYLSCVARPYAILKSSSQAFCVANRASLGSRKHGSIDEILRK